MTHGTTTQTESLLLIDIAIREFKIRTVHSSHTNRRASLIKTDIKPKQQDSLKNGRSDLAGGFGLRRPTKLNPRISLKNRNVPVSSVSKTLPKEDSAVSLEQIKLGPKVHSS
jgi:hypothetical protein